MHDADATEQLTSSQSSASSSFSGLCGFFLCGLRSLLGSDLLLLLQFLELVLSHLSISTFSALRSAILRNGNYPLASRASSPLQRLLGKEVVHHLVCDLGSSLLEGSDILLEVLDADCFELYKRVRSECIWQDEFVRTSPVSSSPFR
jgi:hypothetical protein